MFGLLALVFSAGGVHAQAPRFAQSGPDAEDYGASNGYPIGDRSNWFRPPSSSAPTAISIRFLKVAPCAGRGSPSSLKRAAAGAGAARTSTRARHTRSMTTSRVTRPPGFSSPRVTRSSRNATNLARTDQHRFTSWSMAKAVTAMLVGIAIAEGRIRSVDDPAAVYVPALAGTEYGRTSLRHLLQMSSGVRFVEDYSTPTRDSGRLARRHISTESVPEVSTR